MPRRRSENTNSVGSNVRDPKRRRLIAGSVERLLTSVRSRALGSELAGRRPAITDEEFDAEDQALKPGDREEGTVPKLVSVGYHLVENRKKHHTDEFEIQSLVVRRGDSFQLSVKFDSALDPDVHTVALQFVIGKKAQQSKGNIIRLSIPLVEGSKTGSGPPSNWKCECTSLLEDTLTAEITPPAKALVGRYRLFVEVDNVEDEEEPMREEQEDVIYVLFNAWCPEDIVYMENVAERNEYVLNETGRIWVGTSRNFGGQPWNFGQFDDPCLEAALTLLDKAELGTHARGNPIPIIRIVSAMANSNDEDNGVLTGQWSEPYGSGTKPWEWMGSVAILQEYMETGKAVEYGQCWVFSGIVTTLLRSLGIPTRSITNFESAHDTDSSMTIDNHYDEEGEPIEWRNDSVWNFHVWNESWFKRPDLPVGYDGWQVHDATPQETSEGVMRCGPAPLKAVKEGHVYMNFDIPFVFSEVNGDRVHWEVTKGGEMKVLTIDRGSVGKFISTKAVGSSERLDVTNLYKYPEGSEEERKVVKFVNQYSTRDNVYDIVEQKDVEYELITPDLAELGEGFTVTARAKNISATKQKLMVTISLLGAFYTGIVNRRLKSLKKEIELEPNEEREISIDVSVDEYEGVLDTESSIQAFSRCKILSSGHCVIKRETFMLSKPTIVIEAPENGTGGEEMTITIKFTNPLKKKVTEGAFHVEGSGLTKPQIIKHKKAIAPGEEIIHEFTIIPKKYGHRELMVNFSGAQISGVEGTASIYIRYPE